MYVYVYVYAYYGYEFICEMCLPNVYMCTCTYMIHVFAGVS